MKNSKIINFIKVISVVTLIFVLNLVMIPTTKAGEYENEKDVLTRLKATTLSSHDITFNLSAGTAFDDGETITIDFGEDSSLFAVDGANSTSTDFDFNDGNERTILNVTVGSADCTGSTGTSTVAVGINDTTGVVTFLACTSYTSSAAAATVNIQYGTAATTGGNGTNRVTNPSAGNNKVIYLAGTVGDSGSLAVSILSDDQVVVTATVEPLFTFTISTTTCALGTLTTGAVNSCSYTATSTSNSTDGYTTTIVEDYNLRIDASNDIDDVTDGTVTAGVEEYGILLTGDDKAFSDERRINATSTTIASDATGPINGQTIIVTHKASITATTAAGSYSHTVTLISTGTY